MLRNLPPILTILFLVPGPAWAHALGVDCRIVKERVVLEAYYDDDTPAAGAKVRIIGANQKTESEGKTDAEGKWSCPRPAPGVYTVVVDAGSGHRKEVPLAIPDAAVPPAPPEEPGRAELTSIPWLRLLIGLVLIGAVAKLLLFVRRGTKEPTASPKP